MKTESWNNLITSCYYDLIDWLCIRNNKLYVNMILSYSILQML